MAYARINRWKASRGYRRNRAASRIQRAFRRYRSRRSTTNWTRAKSHVSSSRYSSTKKAEKTLFPAQKYMRQVHCEKFERLLYSSANPYVVPTLMFRQNSIYDVLWAAGLSQKGFQWNDILNVYYGLYKVKFMTISCKLMNFTPGTVNVVAGHIDRQSQLPSSGFDIETCAMLPGSKSVTLGNPEHDAVGQLASSKLIKFTLDVDKWRRRVGINPADSWTPRETNPSLSPYIWMMAKTGQPTTTNSVNVTAQVYSVGYCMYSDLQTGAIAQI